LAPEAHPKTLPAPNTGKGAPIQELDLANEQLKRMRGMTRFYHERFFSDTRWTATGVFVLILIGFWSVPEAFLLVPVVALIGANQTAFDASYLYFARHYAVELEATVNAAMRRRVLVASELEDRYLFRLNDRKLVAIGRDFTWFGWITIFYTLLGIFAFAAGIGLGWNVLQAAGRGWTTAYLGGVSLLTVASLGVGWWWFVSGIGERRLREVLDGSFGVRLGRNGEESQNPPGWPAQGGSAPDSNSSTEGPPRAVSHFRPST
jgi:hypothetical protein